MFLPRDPGPTGKSEHDRHRMGHHVMHLGGDPGTFGEGRGLDALPDELGEGFTAFPPRPYEESCGENGQAQRIENAG